LDGWGQKTVTAAELIIPLHSQKALVAILSLSIYEGT